MRLPVWDREASSSPRFDDDGATPETEPRFAGWMAIPLTMLFIAACSIAGVHAVRRADALAISSAEDEMRLAVEEVMDESYIGCRPDASLCRIVDDSYIEPKSFSLWVPPGTDATLLDCTVIEPMGESDLVWHRCTPVESGGRDDE